MKLLNNIKPSFLGVEMKRDEYLRQEGNKIMAQSHVYSFFLIIILTMVSFIWDVMHEMLSLSTILLLIIGQIANIYFLIKSKHLNILSNDIYTQEDYQIKLKEYKYNAFKFALMIGMLSYAMSYVVIPLLMGEDFKFEWLSIVIVLIINIVLGFVIYFYLKRNLNNEFEVDNDNDKL